MNGRCKCGKEIPEKRVEFLKKYSKAITCIDCTTEERVVGNQVYEAKDTRTIEIVTAEQAKRIEYTYSQKGVNLGSR